MQNLKFYKLNIFKKRAVPNYGAALFFWEVDLMNKDLTMEQIEDIRERVKSGLDVLRSNVIGHQIILNEIRKRVEPIGAELTDGEIERMTEQDFMDLIDYKTGMKQKKEIRYHYEKQEMTCKVGDVLHNNNGSDYRVLEKYSDSNILFQNMETGAFSVGIGVEFFRKLPKPTEEEIVRAKEVINEYCVNEFGHTASFEDYPIVHLGYTENTIEDDSEEYHSIEVLADLENFKFITEVDGEVVGIEQYRNMEDFIEYGLECLSFDSLISLSDDELMDKYKRGDIVLDADDFKGVDYIPVQEKEER